MKFFVATALFATLAVSSAEFNGCARGKFGVYANPTDCSKYTMCVSGAPVTVTCPMGMKFDSRIGTCSPFAKCKAAPVVEEPVHEEPHHEEPVHEEPHHEEPHHEEPIEEPHHEEPIEEPHHEEPAEPAKFSCPRTSGRFADPEDCKRYYICKDGDAAHYQCPAKFNFSSKWGMCLPGVKCTVTKVEEPVHEEPHHEEPHHEEPVHEEPHHEEPHHEEPIEEPHHEEPIEEPHHEEPAEPAKFSCPRASGRFADPENCKRYYSCKDGEAAHYQCPLKFNFSSKLGMCLPGVKCTVTKVEEPVHEEPHHEEPHHEEPHHEEPQHEEPHHEEPIEEPHHEEPIEEPHHEEPVAEGFACPRAEGRFANVHNCRQYHECREGHSEVRTCPFNFRFSRSLGMCLPGIKCVEEPIEEPHHEEPHHEEPHHEEPIEEPHHEEPHHEEPIEEPHHEEPHHEEPIEEPHHEEPIEEPHHEEPAAPEKFTCKKSFGLFADAEDCSKYHMCVRGRAFTVTCPTNTKYDFINKHCQAAHARCLKKNEEVIEEEEIQEEKAFECPVDFGFFPASDCRKFIQCSHGQAHQMECPAGTEWNQDAQACDHMTSRCAAQ